MYFFCTLHKEAYCVLSSFFEFFWGIYTVNRNFFMKCKQKGDRLVSCKSCNVVCLTALRSALSKLYTVFPKPVAPMLFLGGATLC